METGGVDRAKAITWILVVLGCFLFWYAVAWGTWQLAEMVA